MAQKKIPDMAQKKIPDRDYQIRMQNAAVRAQIPRLTAAEIQLLNNSLTNIDKCLTASENVQTNINNLTADWESVSKKQERLEQVKREISAGFRQTSLKTNSLITELSDTLSIMKANPPTAINRLEQHKASVKKIESELEEVELLKSKKEEDLEIEKALQSITTNLAILITARLSNVKHLWKVNTELLQDIKRRIKEIKDQMP